MESVAKNIVLKASINCCEECPKQLEKALKKLTGVSSVVVNAEENLVSVLGTVDSDDLRKVIYAKIRKKAKVIFGDAKSTSEEKERLHNTKHTLDESNSQDKGKMHKTCCCQDGNCPRMKKNVHKCEHEGPKKVQRNCPNPKMEKDEHICEPYEGPPKVNELICRDYYCKLHPRSRKITDKVPLNESSMSMFGHFPNYAQGYYGGGHPWYPTRSSIYPKW